MGVSLLRTAQSLLTGRTIQIVYYIWDKTFNDSYNFSVLRRLLVLQQTYHIVTHTSPHRVTSSNIYQIKAQSLGSSKLHDATVRTEGEIFYSPSTEGTPNTLV